MNKLKVVKIIETHTWVLPAQFTVIDKFKLKKNKKISRKSFKTFIDSFFKKIPVHLHKNQAAVPAGMAPGLITCGAVSSNFRFAFGPWFTVVGIAPEKRGTAIGLKTYQVPLAA